MLVLKAKTLLLTAVTSSFLTGCSFFSAPEREPYYPLLRDATYSNEEIAVIESDNVLKSAIKQNHVVAVAQTQEVETTFDKVFAEAEWSEGISLDDLKSEQFHDGLELLIKQFSCELYASKQPDDSIQLCPQSNKIVDNALAYLPFEDGLRMTQRLSTTQTNKDDTLQIELFLKSTHERPLESLWGAVHELGSFKGSTLSPDKLVLTVNLSAYKKESAAHTWRALYREPLIFFVAIPPVDAIANQPNEVASMNYSYNKAKLIVADSR